MNPGTCRLRALGIVTALGDSGQETWSRLLRGERSHLRKRTDLVPGREVYVGQVPDSCLEEIPVELKAIASRNAQLILAALKQFQEELSQLKRAIGSDRIGVVLGSSTSGIAAGEGAHRALHDTGQFPEWYDYTQQELGTAARAVADLAGVHGPAFTVSTACSSSAKVFGDARALLALELCDAVIVGGADSLCQLTVQGFSSLELVASAYANPMSKNRMGLNIGEGAALFLMTRELGGVQLLGVGESCDAYHMSAPEPSGRGALEAMSCALQDAGCKPSDIDYINLHGTGTIHNDSAESLAIAELFCSVDIPCSSSKPLIGHTLGAAGAVEAAVCFLCLSQEGEKLYLPPHLWDEVADDTLPPIRLVKPGESLVGQKMLRIMSNSFAFGGNNCSLIFGTERAQG